MAPYPRYVRHRQFDRLRHSKKFLALLDDQAARLGVSDREIYEELLVGRQMSFAEIASLAGYPGEGGSVSAPVITQQPSITPAAPRMGDNITLDIGAASGTPAATATWDFTRDGISIKAGLTAGVAMEITQAGVYALSVSWSNGVGSPAVATVAQFTVSASNAPAINYATAALLYLDKDSAYAGPDTGVTTITTTGTSGRILNNNSGTTPVVKVADGWRITDGNRLQTPGFTATNYDGLFVIMDVTLASYGSALGQMLDGTGSRISLRNNNGNIQGIGPASGQPSVALGAANYGSRIVVAVQMDALADVISGYTAAGAQVSAAHVDAGIAPTQFVIGRYCNMTIHRMAIVGRPVGGAWPVTLAEVHADFIGGA